MSRHTIHTPGRSGDLVTERAARRISAHPRAATASAGAPAAPVSPAPSAQPPIPTATQASGARILRRWSVAELIARAAIGQPVIV